ncbi:MAG: hypothetical protein SFU27_07070, partial [Thermonemataceae bacterium]|nr:hypothetical protein [Thermonemataceae bacterium]
PPSGGTVIIVSPGGNTYYPHYPSTGGPRPTNPGTPILGDDGDWGHELPPKYRKLKLDKSVDNYPKLKTTIERLEALPEFQAMMSFYAQHITINVSDISSLHAVGLTTNYRGIDNYVTIDVSMANGQYTEIELVYALLHEMVHSIFNIKKYIHRDADLRPYYQKYSSSPEAGGINNPHHNAMAELYCDTLEGKNAIIKVMRAYDKHPVYGKNKANSNVNDEHYRGLALSWSEQSGYNHLTNKLVKIRIKAWESLTTKQRTDYENKADYLISTYKN